MEAEKPICISDVANLVAALEHDVKLRGVVLPDEYFYSSLPLCIIDAVFSINARYQGVRNVIYRYCHHFRMNQYREDRNKLPDPDKQQPVGQFLATIEAVGPEVFATEILKNRQRTSSRNGILKSEAVLQFGRVLQAHGIEYFQDVTSAVNDEQLCQAIKSIPGQRSGISLQYFFMLSGSDDLIKPDRMIQRYLERVVRRHLTEADAQRLVSDATRQLQSQNPNLTVRLLDYQIWDFQRKQ